jgi:twitching motility protein PilT
MGFDIDAALTYMVEREGSDLHVKVDSPPVARVHGDLWALKDSGVLTGADTEGALKLIADEQHVAEFEENGEVDFSYELEGVSRFRVNAFRQRGAIYGPDGKTYHLQVTNIKRVTSSKPPA